MEVRGHLRDDEVIRALLDSPLASGFAMKDARLADHLEACAICRAEHDRLTTRFAGFGAWARAAAHRPENFWEMQHARIAARLVPEKKKNIRTWGFQLALATAAAVIILAFAIFGTRPYPQQVASTVDDHSLLVDVEHSINDELPAALQPAALLVNEMNRHASPNTKNRKAVKETRYAN
jgi:predicted anti-sigma-YlaC factor YlaD